MFSPEVMSDFLWPSGLQHTTLPCPSPSPRVCLNSCLFSQWCHPIISSSVIPFSCPQSFPAWVSSSHQVARVLEWGAIAFSKELSSDCYSVAPSCPTLCSHVDCSMPGFPVLYYLPEFAQTNVHWVNDAIQSSHPLSPPSPAALNLSQHWDILQCVSTSHQVAKVLEL